MAASIALHAVVVPSLKAVRWHYAEACARACMHGSCSRHLLLQRESAVDRGCFVLAGAMLGSHPPARPCVRACMCMCCALCACFCACTWRAVEEEGVLLIRSGVTSRRLKHKTRLRLQH